MISYKEGDVYLSNSNIIYNPVCIKNNVHGFIPRIKKLHPMAYEEYKDMVHGDSLKRLKGEVQLVEIRNRQFMMNGICKEKNGYINKLWLVKNLVELVNLGCEYNLSIGLEYGLGVQNSMERHWIDLIMQAAFDNVEIPITIYDRLHVM